MNEFIAPDASSWLEYHRAYLAWMQSVNHPSLRDSNYFAKRFREGLV